MIKFQEEKFEDIREELPAILEEFWSELAAFQDKRPLCVDYERYSLLSNMGYLRVYTARDEGKLIGYGIFVLSTHLRYSDWYFATSDMYYTLPQYRKTGLGSLMFDDFEKRLVAAGVKSIVVADRVNNSRSEFFGNRGYIPTERSYEKLI